MKPKIKIRHIKHIGCNVNLLQLSRQKTLKITDFGQQSLVCELHRGSITVRDLVTMQGVIFLDKGPVPFDATGAILSLREVSDEALCRVEIQLRQFNKAIWNNFLSATENTVNTKSDVLEGKAVVTGKEKLGELLRSKRLAAGLTQREVSDALGYSSPQFVSNWERNISVPPIHSMLGIAKLLKADEHELFNLILETTIAEATEDLERKFKRTKKR